MVDTAFPTQRPADGGRPGEGTFAIVVTAYEVARFLGETVASVLAQDDPDWRLVVVDDGSSDRPDAVMAGFDDPRIRFVRQSHGGKDAALQNGLAHADGVFVVILDGDDRLRPGALSAFRRTFALRPAAGFVFGRRVLCDEDGRFVGAPLRWRLRRRLDGPVLRRTLRACPVTTLGQAAFRRDALERAGGLPEVRSALGDWTLCAVLAAVTEFAEIDDVVLDYRLRRASVMRSMGARAGAAADLDIDEFDPVIRQMYDSPLIRGALGAGERRRMERRSRARAYCVKGYECLRTRHWAPARRYLRHGLRDDPLNLPALACLLFARIGWLPGFLRTAMGQDTAA